MTDHLNSIPKDSPSLEEPRIKYISTPAINRYVNILIDKWFKRILGSEDNSQTLIGILRELIPERNIVSLNYETKPLRKRKRNPFSEGHDAFFDVECTDADGTRFVVEMQMNEQVHFHERALFYATYPIQEQVIAQNKDMPYRSHDEQYNYPPVYVIGFLNFTLHPQSQRILYRYDLREQTDGELMSDRLNFIFLEMPNYHGGEPLSSDSFIEKLSYALMNMGSLSERPAALMEEVFCLLFEACELEKLTLKDKQQYEQDIMTTEMDRRNILYTRELRGYERGLGQGREEGREEERLKNAANLKRLGVPIETIAKGTGLSEEQVRAL